MSFLHILSLLRAPFLDSLMLFVSYAGTPFFIAAVIVAFYLCVDKKAGWGMLFAFLFSGIAAQCMKLIFRVPRPWNLDTSFEPVAAAVASATGYSFPSIHSQSAAALFGTLFHYYKKKRTRIFFCLCLILIVFSRMYLGCHTPLDVFVGVLTGAVISAIVLMFWEHNRHTVKNDGILLFFLGAFALVLIFLAGAFMWNGTVEFKEAKDGLQTAGLALGTAPGFWLERTVIRFKISGTRKEKFLRILIVLSGALAIMLGLKAIRAASPALTLLRFFLTGFWMTGAAPAICLKAGIMRKE